MEIPETREDLEAFVSRRVQESLHLDYKDSRALAGNLREIAKDVSAFANADGGLLIFGIREENHLPVAVDEGVLNKACTREQLEQTISSNIAPRIEGVIIRQIPLNETHSAYCIQIPKSHRAPHQERSAKRYYKRHNFESVPMEDYELTDLRSRARAVQRLVSFDVDVRNNFLFLFVVGNHGELPAFDVRFEFSKPLTWRDPPPGIIERGISSLPPGREYHVFYGSSPELLNEQSEACVEFEVVVTYYHPAIRERIAETYSINLRDYLGTWAPPAPLEEFGKKLESNLKDIRKELGEIRKALEALSPLAGPSGLQVSVRSLRELVESFGHIPKLRKRALPPFYGGNLLEEILEIDRDLAHRLAHHFWRSLTTTGLEKVEGVTPDLIVQIQELFITDEPEPILESPP